MTALDILFKVIDMILMPGARRAPCGEESRMKQHDSNNIPRVFVPTAEYDFRLASRNFGAFSERNHNSFPYELVSCNVISGFLLSAFLRLLPF